MEQFIPDSTRKKIIEKLSAVGVKWLCPMCGGTSFSFNDGYFVPILQDNIHAKTLSGRALPTISAACKNCGFLTQHVLGALGLLGEKEGKNVEAE